nr:unnamed protein product [Spirometra erinaceieuropaei]
MASSPPEMLPGDGLKSFTWKNPPPPYRVKDFGQECKPKIPDLYLYEVSKSGDCVPRNNMKVAIDAWDEDHVKLPCSSKNLHTENGTSVERWDIIRQALSGLIQSAEEFEKAVLSYNEDYARGIWDADILAAALQQRPDFKPLLKKIADLALKLPDLIIKPIPLMRQNEESSISLSQMQIACLLANAFYCTFPGRSSANSKHEQPTFPAVNFNALFFAFSSRGTEAPIATEIEKVGRQFRYKVEKIICILHYFSRVLGEEGPPTGAVTFSRRCLNNPPDFQSSEVLIGSVPFGTSSKCRIEDAGSDTMQASITADIMWRNAFVGFTDMAAPYQALPSVVVSGNWGCGVFRGNKGLKALIQLMACAQAGKSLAYCTFEDESLEKELQRVHDSLVASDCTVGRLWSILTRLNPPKRLREDEQTAYVLRHVTKLLSRRTHCACAV